jgi:hypothetical protein
MTDWTRAADALEATLEAAARMVDGEADASLPEVPHLDLSLAPERGERDRVTRLLADAEEAAATVAHRQAEITQELNQSNKLRVAGRAYLRY